MKHMSEEIRQEQEKLANHFKALAIDEKEKQAYGLLCWLQGHEAGYQAGLTARDENGKIAES